MRVTEHGTAGQRDASAERDPEATLRERFGLAGFRPWQREAIDAVLAPGSRVLVVAPTGGGKSLTYQLPAVLLRGTTVVVSPLVALMEDQVRSLAARGIEATYLASTLAPDVRYAREVSLRQGRYKLVYVAPERLAHDGFVELLARLEPPLVAIDEAHCIAQWGHDFRPDYARLGPVLERLGAARVLACTATATPLVRREIVEKLGFSQHRELLRGFARPNLHLEARTVDGPTEAQQRVHQELLRVLGGAVRPRGGAIVYAATRKQTEVFAAALARKGWNVAAYHAGLEGAERSRVATAFASRALDVVVATNAFGMGIDRADIRAVLHAQPPASIEAYYQEVGRAGRDGAEAFGLLLCSGQDIALRRRLCQLASDGGEADPALAARNWRLFRDLLRYLDAGTCRHDFVLRYFGDEGELLGGCGHCDVCAELDGDDEPPVDGEAVEEQARAERVVKIALSGVARAKGRAGMTAIAEMLKGAANARTERFGFTRLSTFGLLREHPLEWVLTVLRGAIAAGWVDLTPTEHPVPLLTQGGWEVLRGERPVRYRLPRAASGAGARRAGRSARAAGGVPAADAAVYERLRAARASLAKQHNVPAYVVAHDRTLAELAAQRPSDAGALARVYGMGPARVEQYGAQLLAALRATATPG